MICSWRSTLEAVGPTPTLRATLTPPVRTRTMRPIRSFKRFRHRYHIPTKEPSNALMTPAGLLVALGVVTIYHLA
ncbi:hypothetical protein EVAR_83719_1 [Eumeta japonica]|uniref:Uncharacterized protein n=1 Tax=Eumeta variegata TaxID=151549 RepID=A0A4C1W9F2_EUMVA|nr:hypothetical protein EVAR_83719_1 [Eumeta japonica]